MKFTITNNPFDGFTFVDQAEDTTYKYISMVDSNNTFIIKRLKKDNTELRFFLSRITETRTYSTLWACRTGYSYLRFYELI